MLPHRKASPDLIAAQSFSILVFLRDNLLYGRSGCAVHFHASPAQTTWGEARIISSPLQFWSLTSAAGAEPRHTLSAGPRVLGVRGLAQEPVCSAPSALHLLLCSCVFCCPGQGESRAVAFCQVSRKSLQERDSCVFPAAASVGIQIEVVPSCAELGCKVHR